MQKLIVGLVALGAFMALRPAVKRRMAQKMREHCGQMMAQFAGPSEAAGQKDLGPETMRRKMREHCEQMAAKRKENMEQFGVRGEEAGVREHSEPTAAAVGA